MDDNLGLWSVVMKGFLKASSLVGLWVKLMAVMMVVSMADKMVAMLEFLMVDN